MGTYSGDGRPVRASAFSAGRNLFASCLWLLMPSRSTGICENHRSGRLPPAVSLHDRTEPRGRREHGQPDRGRRAAHAGHVELDRALDALSPLPRERQLDRRSGRCGIHPSSPGSRPRWTGLKKSGGENENVVLPRRASDPAVVLLVRHVHAGVAQVLEGGDEALIGDERRDVGGLVPGVRQQPPGRARRDTATPVRSSDARNRWAAAARLRRPPRPRPRRTVTGSCTRARRPTRHPDRASGHVELAHRPSQPPARRRRSGVAPNSGWPPCRPEDCG